MSHTEHENDSWTISVGDHPGRANTPLYGRSRKHMIAAVQTVQPWYFGPPPYQDHHGGGVWVLRPDGKPALYLLPAGIEWSAQFCADPAKVEVLRQAAEALVDAFAGTRVWYLDVLGMTATDLAILGTPILSAAGVAAWTDSFWNASVPLPQSMHTGFPPKSDPGYHHAPKPIVDIRLFARDDFVLFPQAGLAVVPVAAPGSGDGRVRVVWDAVYPDSEPDRILPAHHPVALAAFVHQQGDAMSLPSPTPTPDPVPTPPVLPTPPAPAPAPVLPSPDLTSATWWQWALTTVVSFGIGIGVLIGHPFNSAIIEAIVPSVALFAASFATALQVHGVHKVQIARLAYEREIIIAQINSQGSFGVTTLLGSGSDS